LENAAYVAERMRSSIENHPFDVGGGKILRITVSIGTAARDEGLDSPQALVAAADEALYAAKEQGRNRVCRFNS
jgi:diguanylate cyclase (GGDEF)-like protein